MPPHFLVFRAQQRRRRRVGLAVAGLSAIALAVAVIDRTDWLSDAFSWDKVDALWSELADGWVSAVLNPWYWGLIAAFIVVERLWPAEPNGGMLSIGGAPV